MKAVGRFSLAALALGLVAAPAQAQLFGLPVAYSPAAAGVTIGGMFGRGLNTASGKSNSAGGMVTIGLPTFQVSAGASYVGFGGDNPIEKISFGGNAGYKLPLPPETPVSVAVVAGVGYLSADGTTQLSVPVGPALSINVPSTGVAVTPWVSPQFRYFRTSGGGFSGSSSSWGVAGGVCVGFGPGVGVNLALDYHGESEAFLVGAGLHYTIKTPGLGGGGGM